VSKAQHKYLQHYAEPEIHKLTGFPDYTYQHVLMVPVYHEEAKFLSRLLNQPRLQGPLLVILVINAPSRPSPTPSQNKANRQTQDLLVNLIQINKPLWKNNDSTVFLSEYRNRSSIHLLLVDRCNHGSEIPKNEGVGLARKIGNDLACALIRNGNILTQWIQNTDADVILPTDYFNIKTSRESSACIYPFRHCCEDPAFDTPMALYERSLRYYVAGLKWAGSPYAYHTIGSTLAINAEYYCQARGFPKRNGAEDFYLLNKLNKLAPVKPLETPTLNIAGRPSERVPFGTGPALQKIKAYKNPEEEYLFYNPKIFAQLKTWLSSYSVVWEHAANGVEQHQLLHSCLGGGKSDSRLIAALKYLNVDKAIHHSLKQSKDRDAFVRQMNIWFDAFRTLKFIHFMRDQYFPSQLLENSVEIAPFKISAQLL